MRKELSAVALAAFVFAMAWIGIFSTALVNDKPVSDKTVAREYFAAVIADKAEEAPSIDKYVKPIEPEPQQEPEPVVDEPYYEEYYEPVYHGGGGDSPDGFKSQGQRAGVDSDTETYYSSNVAYHYRTGEWTADEEGYYRDANGYYVVSSDDYPADSVIQTSKGEARVYDSGAGEGNTDFYVNW